MEFKCEQCQGVFEKGRSDEEAIAEAMGIHGKEIYEHWHNQDEVAVICDDCFEKLKVLWEK